VKQLFNEMFIFDDKSRSTFNDVQKYFSKNIRIISDEQNRPRPTAFLSYIVCNLRANWLIFLGVISRKQSGLIFDTGRKFVSCSLSFTPAV